jgi:hypothetical protein
VIERLNALHLCFIKESIGRLPDALVMSPQDAMKLRNEMEFPRYSHGRMRFLSATIVEQPTCAPPFFTLKCPT